MDCKVRKNYMTYLVFGQNSWQKPASRSSQSTLYKTINCLSRHVLIQQWNVSKTVRKTSDNRKLGICFGASALIKAKDTVEVFATHLLYIIPKECFAFEQKNKLVKGNENKIAKVSSS